MTKGEKVIVFGGSGFLGSHVSDALSEGGYHVKIFDINASPYIRPDQEMIIGDLLDEKAVTEAVRGCRYVYNLAGLADVDDAAKDPVTTAKLNVLGNVNALEASRLAGVKRFIFSSSVYVYSEFGSFYRASKQSAERFVEAYQECFDLDYTILRYGTLYGRRSDERNGVYRFLKEALLNKTISFKGSRNAVREYIHVSDAARLSVRILDEKYSNRHIVLTGQEKMTVENMMKMIAEMMKEDIQFRFQDAESFHYEMTPYAFNPRVGNKLVSNNYIDIGQGLLDCLAEIHENLFTEKRKEIAGDWIIYEES